MTRLGDLGNFSKPLATKHLPKTPTFLGNFCKGVKIFNFLVKSFLVNFYRHLAIFTGHTEYNASGVVYYGRAFILARGSVPMATILNYSFVSMGGVIIMDP